jgi:hypothetical protein
MALGVPGDDLALHCRLSSRFSLNYNGRSAHDLHDDTLTVKFLKRAINTVSYFASSTIDEFHDMHYAIASDAHPVRLQIENIVNPDGINLA